MQMPHGSIRSDEDEDLRIIKYDMYGMNKTQTVESVGQVTSGQGEINEPDKADLDENRHDSPLKVNQRSIFNVRKKPNNDRVEIWGKFTSKTAKRHRAPVVSRKGSFNLTVGTSMINLTAVKKADKLVDDIKFYNSTSSEKRQQKANSLSGSMINLQSFS